MKNLLMVVEDAFAGNLTKKQLGFLLSCRKTPKTPILGLLWSHKCLVLLSVKVCKKPLFGFFDSFAIYCSPLNDIKRCNIGYISQSCKSLRLEYITRFLTCQYTGPFSSYGRKIKVT